MKAPEKNAPEWLERAADWQALLHHFEFSTSFAFVLVLVPSEAIATTCREALEEYLAAAGKTLQMVPILSSADLETLPGVLVSDDAGQLEGAACIWVQRVASRDAASYPEWRAAWRTTVSRLNQFRNPLSRQISGTLVFVGAPWLKQVLREDAPDLWSIRSLVAEIRPEVEAGRDMLFSREAQRAETGPAPDPELALEELAKLAEHADSKVRMNLLLRAADGLFKRREFDRAEKLLRQALESAGANSQNAAHIYLLLGALAQADDRIGEAEDHYLHGLNVSEQLDLQDEIALASYGLGTVARARGQFDTASEWYLRSLVFYEREGDVETVAKICEALGAIAQKQGQFEAARNWYFRSLAVSERQGNTTALASLYQELGALADDQHDIDGASEWYRKAVAAYEQLGDVYRVALTHVGLSLLAGEQGKWEEAGVSLIKAFEGFVKTTEEATIERFLPYFFGIYERASAHERQVLENHWREAGLGEFKLPEKVSQAAAEEA